MNRYKSYKSQKGVAFITSMAFLCVFSALAVGLATMSDTNAQIAENHRKADSTRACAESGFEITRLWLNQVAISGLTPDSEQYNELATGFRSAVNSISSVTVIDQGSTTIISNVVLNTDEGQNFYARLEPHPDQITYPKTMRAEVIGKYGPLTRTIHGNYVLGTRAHSVFDYGVATKGALSLEGNVALGSDSITFDGDVYIESENSDDNALIMTGPSQIAGDVYITNSANPDTIVSVGSNSSIGGEYGQAAVDNHVFTGAAPTEFPIPNPGHFEPYVMSEIDLNDVYFENVRIPPNTDPTFDGDVTFKGVVFIEPPNVVVFSGQANITGIIVGNGDLSDNSGTNLIMFMGGVNSQPVEQLTEPQFAGLSNETGTFIMAPGFGVGFGGNFETLNGVIAANGVNFFGEAGGTIEGSIINYSDSTLGIAGSTNLTFKRSGTDEVPAGFVQDIILEYVPGSYREVIQ